MAFSVEQEKVFDLSLYKDFSSDTKKKVLVEDLAGLYLEAGDIRIKERINPRSLSVINGKVIDPISGTEVNKNWRYDTDLFAKESRGAERFYNLLLGPLGSLVINISPPGPFDEARINVGLRSSETEIELYGVPSHLGKIQCWRLALLLSEFSDTAVSDDPEDLRETAISIKVPSGRNPWGFLKEIASIENNAWDAILEGKPWQMKKKVLESAESIVNKEMSTFEAAKTERGYVFFGNRLEIEMQRNLGWRLLASACPGLFNSQILMSGDFVYSWSLVKDAFGNIRKTRWEYHVGHCQKCGDREVEVGPCQICKKCEREPSRFSEN